MRLILRIKARIRNVAIVNDFFCYLFMFLVFLCFVLFLYVEFLVCFCWWRVVFLVLTAMVTTKKRLQLLVNGFKFAIGRLWDVFGAMCKKCHGRCMFFGVFGFIWMLLCF